MQTIQLDKKHHNNNSMIKGYANNEIRGTIEGEGFVVGGGGEDPCHESWFCLFRYQYQMKGCTQIWPVCEF